MSHNYQPAPEGKDPILWEVAQKRVSFKSHLITYLVVNAFFWAIWYFTVHKNDAVENDTLHLPWPVWPMVGWGIGLVFHFMGAYVVPKKNLIENEYQKLKNKQNK
jgi:hypothetical protein